MGDEVRLEENFFQWTITITSFTGRSLGVTKMSGLVHPDQHVRTQPRTACAGQLIDGEVVAHAAPAIADGEPGSRGRGPPGNGNTLTNQPRKCRSDTIIAGIISEKSESSFAPSHSFCRCTTFWRGAGQQPSTWRGRSEQILLNQVGCEARKIPADAGVFFLDFYLYRTYQISRNRG
jgi:hypothetical protein